MILLKNTYNKNNKHYCNKFEHNSISKMKTKSIILLYVSLLSISQIYCQHTEQTLSRNMFGINAGALTGLGFSYKRLFANSTIQMSFIPVANFSTDNDNSDDFFIYSAGISYIKTLQHHKYYNFTFYTGTHVTNMFTEYSAANIGCGLGFVFNTNFYNINLLLGYGAFDFLNETVLWPSAEIGWFYYF